MRGRPRACGGHAGEWAAVRELGFDRRTRAAQASRCRPSTRCPWEAHFLETPAAVLAKPFVFISEKAIMDPVRKHAARGGPRKGKLRSDTKGGKEVRSAGQRTHPQSCLPLPTPAPAACARPQSMHRWSHVSYDRLPAETTRPPFLRGSLLSASVPAAPPHAAEGQGKGAVLG